ncbi:leucine aminopeptidase 2 [Quercus suber]|uniref:Leucine aminopeptidase 2 n=1 Tax=Quercus suber TaxID=58331 RepID=A0AAW0LAB5_QUESU
MLEELSSHEWKAWSLKHDGAITAALFLKQFVDEKVQWMHIDLAGPVWNDKKRAATGFGISTLVDKT